MTTILTDSMAREHQAEIQALVRNNRRVSEARSARRSARRATRRERRAERATGGAGDLVHTVARPITAAQRWLVAGQL